MMGNLGEELEELEKLEKTTQESTPAPAPEFQPIDPAGDVGLQQQVSPEEWEEIQLKMKYLDALGRKKSGQLHARRQQSSAEQQRLSGGGSRASRRMFKRKSGKD